jgi:hypothetical protein
MTSQIRPSVAAVAALLAMTAATLAGQVAIPVQGGRGAGGAQGGRGAPPSNLPASPVVTPIPTVSAEITGPGPVFESLMKIRSGVDLHQFNYEAKEYFVSGTARQYGCHSW